MPTHKESTSPAVSAPQQQPHTGSKHGAPESGTGGPEGRPQAASPLVACTSINSCRCLLPLTLLLISCPAVVLQTDHRDRGINQGDLGAELSVVRVG
jgi:hypothetical protein